MRKRDYEGPNYGSGIRIGKILYLLYKSPHGVLRSEFQEMFEISIDTIRRYKRQVLTDFVDNGEPLVEVIKLENGDERWKIREEKQVKNKQIRDILSLYMAGSLMSFLEGTGVAGRIKGMAEEVKGFLAPMHLAKLKDFEKKIFYLPYGPKDYKGQNQIVETILGALIHNEVLNIRWKGKSGEKQFLLEPYTLVMYKYGLYLVGKGKGEEKTKTYRVENIINAERTEELFTYPKNYDPWKLYQDSFGMIKEGEKIKVKIFFDNEVKEYIENRRWHPTQKIIKSDGGIIVGFEVEGTKELVSWVMSFGDHAKILEPQALSDEVIKILEQMQKNYQKNKLSDVSGF